MKKEVHVIGGGFSGMTLALKLAEQGLDVHLHEKSNRLGGMLKTEKVPYGLVESAANGILLTKSVESLFSELGLHGLAPLRESKRRFFFREGLKQWPLQIGETIKFATKIMYHLLTRKRRLVPQRMESLQRWGDRNIGSQSTRFLLGPALQGIYAGDLNQMSASLILGPLFKKNRKRNPYRGTYSALEGMQELVNALEKKLGEVGVKIHLNATIELKNFKEVPTVIATSVKAAAELLWPVDPGLASTLKRVNTAPLVSVTCFFRRYQTKYQGFGALIPRGLSLRALGVLFNSYIFAGRDSFYSETYIFGGATDQKINQLSNVQIRELIEKEREIIFEEKLPLVELYIHRWPDGLPYYDLSLEQVLREVSTPHGLYLHGNYMGGIGLSKILDRSIELAKEISQNAK